MAVVGYLTIMFTLMGINVLLGITPDKSMDVGLQVLFYGLYFGVLSRDFSVLCTDKMATRLGVSSKYLLAFDQLQSFYMEYFSTLVVSNPKFFAWSETR